MDVLESTILQQIRQRAMGSYDQVKGCEAEAGGRSLPGGLKNAVTQVSRMKLDKTEKDGKPFAFIYSSCVEPLEHARIFTGFMFMLDEDQYNSFNENFQTFLGALKLMSPVYREIIERKETTEEVFWSQILPWIIQDVNAKKPYILFNTSNRPTNKGEFRAFIAGSVAAGYVPPQRPSVNQHAQAGYVPYQGGPPPMQQVPQMAVIPGYQQMAPGIQASPQGGIPGIPMSGPPLPAPAPQQQMVAAPPLPAPMMAPSPACPVQVGQMAHTINDYYRNGQVYSGPIARIDQEKRVAFLQLGNDLYDIPWTHIAPDSPMGVGGPSPQMVVPQFQQPQAQIAPAIGSGTRVKTDPAYFGTGSSFVGMVQVVNNGKATVDFGNNQVAEIPLANLSVA